MGSGNCSGVGGFGYGRFRPLGPSGDDCIEVFAVVDVEGPLDMTADAGVTVNGTEVTIFCFGEDWANSVGDCQHLLGSPLAMTADVIELGFMLGLDPASKWVASSRLQQTHDAFRRRVSIIVCAGGRSISLAFGTPHLVTYRRARGHGWQSRPHNTRRPRMESVAQGVQ